MSFIELWVLLHEKREDTSERRQNGPTPKRSSAVLQGIASVSVPLGYRTGWKRGKRDSERQMEDTSTIIRSDDAENPLVFSGFTTALTSIQCRRFALKYFL